MQYKILIFFIISILTTLFMYNCQDNDSYNIDNEYRYNDFISDSEPGGSWTIMVYLDGDNNLEENALIDMNEMESVNLSGENINIIVLVDRIDGYSSSDGDWTGTRLYEINYDTDPETISSIRLQDPTYLNLIGTGNDDTEELNMGDPANVTSFVNFCKANYSTDYYTLIFWNHGGGWRNNTSSEQTINKSVCWDDTDGYDYLEMNEIRTALDSGMGIQIIGFDACLMAMAEVAYELRGLAEYMIASEENEPLEGWAYDYFLNRFLQSNKSPLNFCQSVVDTYIVDTPYSYLTLSTVDLNNMENLKSAVDSFAYYLISTDDNYIADARTNTVKFYYSNYMDLYGFTEQLTYINGALALLSEIDNAVAYSRNDKYPGTYGISIYFPYSQFVSTYSEYNETVIDFPSGSPGWDEFLDDYFTY